MKWGDPEANRALWHLLRKSIPTDTVITSEKLYF